MIHKLVTIPALVLAFGLMALAVACGGDDSTGQGATASTEATESAAAPTSATPTSGSSAAATAAPSDTSAATRTPRPTDAPGPDACKATAHVNNLAPPGKFTEIVTGVLVCDGASPDGAKMRTVWHEKSAAKTCSGTADVTGQADCSRIISLTSGFTVVIDVTFSLGDSTYTASTSFTPQ
jgi:cytoskeletal protein RodZ